MATPVARTYQAPYQTVFDTTVRVFASLKMVVGSADPAQGIIVASAGMSAFSWGENITIRLGAFDNTETTVSIESSAKVLFTYGKNQRNIDKIFDAIGQALHQGPPPA